MHELSIAASIVEIAEEFAVAHKAGKINKIEIIVGKLSGVMPDSLEFAMEFAVKDTVLEHAEIVLEEVDGKSVCNVCKAEYVNNDWYTACPVCNSMDSEILEGKELKVKSIFFD